MSDLDEYINSHTEKEPEVLRKLTRTTHLNVLRPRMLSGNLQSQLLRMICKMIGAKRVLEIGTYTAYASIAMASALPDDGVLHTIDINDETEDIVNEYVEKSKLSKIIKFHRGDARKIIPKIDEIFDLVFIDADKREYPEYYNIIFDKVRSGGIIIADDVIWDGKVVDKDACDAQTLGIKAFNDMVMNDDRVEKVMLNIRHGLYLIRKL